jgi:hypothetical protein
MTGKGAERLIGTARVLLGLLLLAVFLAGPDRANGAGRDLETHESFVMGWSIDYDPDVWLVGGVDYTTIFASFEAGFVYINAEGRGEGYELDRETCLEAWTELNEAEVTVIPPSEMDQPNVPEAGEAALMELEYESGWRRYQYRLCANASSYLLIVDWATFEEDALEQGIGPVKELLDTLVLPDPER